MRQCFSTAVDIQSFKLDLAVPLQRIRVAIVRILVSDVCWHSRLILVPNVTPNEFMAIQNRTSIV